MDNHCAYDRFAEYFSWILSILVTQFKRLKCIFCFCLQLHRRISLWWCNRFTNPSKCPIGVFYQHLIMKFMHTSQSKQLKWTIESQTIIRENSSSQSVTFLWGKVFSVIVKLNPYGFTSTMSVFVYFSRIKWKQNWTVTLCCFCHLHFFARIVSNMSKADAIRMRIPFFQFAENIVIAPRLIPPKFIFALSPQKATIFTSKPYSFATDQMRLAIISDFSPPPKLISKTEFEFTSQVQLD